jgi:SAM-dependent methyltransferase
MSRRWFKVLRRIWYTLPFKLRLAGGGLFDRRDDSEDLLPPRSMRLLVGPGDFVEIGRATVAELVAHAGLTPQSSFLDAGCGVGRLAIALTRYLDPETPYRGFDVVPEFVRWCETNITPRHPSFRFALIDVANSEYNRGGGLDASSTAFPYDDGQFDFLYAGSVFTHLLWPGSANYIREGARVLRDGGISATTFFLMNDESRRLVDSGCAHMPLRHEIADGGRVLDPRNPEADVGHEEHRVRAAFTEAGLRIEKILYGSWCGRADAAPGHYQDLIIARRQKAKSR